MFLFLNGPYRLAKSLSAENGVEDRAAKSLNSRLFMNSLPILGIQLQRSEYHYGLQEGREDKQNHASSAIRIGLIGFDESTEEYKQKQIEMVEQCVEVHCGPTEQSFRRENIVSKVKEEQQSVIPEEDSIRLNNNNNNNK